MMRIGNNMRRQNGFILVLTMGMLVIVAIAAGYFAERVGRSVELAQQARQNIQVVVDQANMRAEILFRLGTTSFSAYGLGLGPDAIILDNRLYHGIGTSFLRLQDNRGLLNLNQADDASLQRFLGVLGVPADQRGRMVDTLRDYIDADNLHRINGAEAQDYIERGLPPPTNTRLITSWDAKRIMGWNVPQLWRDNQFVSLTTTSLAVGINPNTAAAQVLASLPGVTDEIARNMVKHRQVSPFANIDEVASFSGVSPAQFIFTMSFFPSDSIRVIQLADGGHFASEFSISLTPTGKDAPWRINYHTHIDNTLTAAETQQAQELPQRINLPPATAATPFFGK